MLIAILIIDILTLLGMMLMYPLIAYATDRNMDAKLAGRDEKSLNLESRVFMYEDRLDQMERAVRKPEPIVAKESGREKRNPGMAGIPRG